MLRVDAAFSLEQALVGVSAGCPDEVLAAQRLVEVDYPGEDGGLHRGQIVVDRELVDDVVGAFALIVDLGMPVGMAVPLADPRFVEEGIWSDDLSMAANNASGFNYRVIKGTDRLSRHAFGRAVDINPLWNPMFRGGECHPPLGVFDPRRPGTFTGDHPVVAFFESRGWEWGGRWQQPWDLHHFQR